LKVRVYADGLALGRKTKFSERGLALGLIFREDSFSRGQIFAHGDFSYDIYIYGEFVKMLQSIKQTFSHRHPEADF